MLLTVLLFVIPSAVGVAAVAAARIFSEKITVLLVGVTTGLAAFTTIAYLIFLVTPPTPLALWVMMAALGGGVVVGGYKPWRTWWQLPSDYVAVAILVSTLALFSIIAPKLLVNQDDGLATGIINAYGDLGWHLANITLFPAQQSAPPENPIFAGTYLTYPFLVNIFSGLLLVAGAPLNQTVTLPALVLIPTLLTLFYCLVTNMTEHRRLAAVVAVLLFLFGGAVAGWTRWPAAWEASGQTFLAFMVHLPPENFSGVGADAGGLHFLNATTSLLLPQRSLLFGFPLAFTILLLLTTTPQKPSLARFLLAGALAGLLPLFHAHTVLALLPAILGIFILDWRHQKNSRELISRWLMFTITAACIGLPEVLYYLRGTAGGEGSFLRFEPGWTVGEMNPLWFWFANTGLLIPVTLFGLFLPAPRLLKALAGAGISIFVVANLYLFAPWAWDNFKLFIYFLLFILPLVGYVCGRYLTSPTPVWLRTGVVVLLVGHLLSGGLDIWKITLPTAQTWHLWSSDDVAAAAMVKEATAPDAIVVTAPTHNSAVVLAGRKRYLGYAAHAWSHGLSPWNREESLKKFFTGTLDSLPEAPPDYLLVGPQEHAAYPELIVQPNWEIVAQDGQYTLYRLPQ